MAASAAATLAVSGAVVGSMRNSSALGSSPAYGSRFLQVAPIRPAAKRLSVVAKASLPEEQTGRTARREMLAGLMAVSAAIVASDGALATSTQDKAKDLLKNADELTNNESPTRFGPSQDGGSNPGNVAQKGGAGAVEELQGGTNNAVETAKQRVEEAKGNFNRLFQGKNNGPSLPDLGVQVPNLGNVKGKVDSDIATTKGKVESDISTTEKGVKGLGNKFNSNTGNAGSAVADAQSKVDEASKSITGKGKQFF